MRTRTVPPVRTDADAPGPPARTMRAVALTSEGCNMSGFSGVSSDVTLDGAVGTGWWLVARDANGSGDVLAGPYPDREQAAWDAATREMDGSGAVRAVYGVRRADGPLLRRPSPQDWAWLTHLGDQ